MFCPVCKAEYRQGFTHCSDCDVDLVDSLDAADSVSESAADSGLREVWQGPSQEECGLLCDQLRAAQVPFEVLQSKDNLFHGAGQGFRIAVPGEVADHAVALITQWLAELEYQRGEAMELPAEDQDDGGAPDLTASRRPRGPWHPEDATVEVASGEAPEFGEMIEASLRENEIRTRTEIAADRSRTIFVAPDDESQAREIIREIKDATPRS